MTNPPIRRPLADLFKAMHHAKFDFNDFMHGDMNSYYEILDVGGGGYERQVYKPNKTLKAYHTFLNLFIFEYLPMLKDVVFSYRKGCTVYDAVSLHANSKYFFQTDIKSFFPSIDRQLVKKTILSGAGATPVSDIEDSIERILDLVCVNDSLPVGFPASSLLSNAVLYSFDNELKKYADIKGLIYTRYSDDIVISSESKESIQDIGSLIQTELSNVSDKLMLNIVKSKYFQTGQRIKILGMVILPNGTLTIDSNLKNEVEILLHFYINDREKFKNYILKTKAIRDEQKAIERIAGYLNYVNSIDQAYLNKLRKKYGATVIDTLVHRVVS